MSLANQNPYTPSTSPLQDAHPWERRDPPVAIVVAVVLQAVGLLWGLCWLPSMWKATMTGELAAWFLLANVVGWVVATVLCVKIWRGRNWARIVLAVLTALSLVGMFAQIPSGARQFEAFWVIFGGAELFKLVLMPIINIATVVLLFGPGRAWFARRP